MPNTPEKKFEAHAQFAIEQIQRAIESMHGGDELSTIEFVSEARRSLVKALRIRHDRSSADLKTSLGDENRRKSSISVGDGFPRDENGALLTGSD